MKLKFKKQSYQTHAVEAVADCFAGQPVHAAQVLVLIDSVFSDTQLPEIGDDRKAKTNPLNANFEKVEFKALWNRINHKAACTVEFETPERVAP